MAIYYVWSGAAGLNDGTSWTDAYTAFASAVTAASTLGDIILIHKASSETLNADTTYTANSNHTPTNPLQCIVVDKDASDLPVDDYTDMGVNGIDAGSTYHIFLTGNFYFWGIRITTGDTSSSFSGEISFENSEYTMDAATGESINTGALTKTTFINSKLTFAGAGKHRIKGNGDGGTMYFLGGSITAVTNDTVFFEVGALQGDACVLNGVNLSGINPTSSWASISSGSENCRFEMRNCYLPASPPALVNSDIGTQSFASALNCGGTDGRYYSYRSASSSTMIHDTTTHRDGGAEYDGTNGYSFNVITSGVVEGVIPFRQLLAVLDGGSLNTKTLEIHITHDNTDNSNNIQDDEIWAEFHSLQNSVGVRFETTRPKPTATPSNLAASSETWTSGKTYKQKISHAWSGGATTGLVYCYICVAKAFAGGSGDDVFICPKVEIV